MASGHKAEVVGPLFTWPPAEEEDLLLLGLVRDERMQQPHAGQLLSGAGVLRGGGRLRDRDACHRRACGPLRCGGFPRDRGDGRFRPSNSNRSTIQRPASGRTDATYNSRRPARIEPSQELAQARKQRPGHPLVKLVGQLAWGGMTDHLIAIGHEVVEQVLQTHRRRAPFFFLPSTSKTAASSPATRGRSSRVGPSRAASS